MLPTNQNKQQTTDNNKLADNNLSAQANDQKPNDDIGQPIIEDQDQTSGAQLPNNDLSGYNQPPSPLGGNPNQNYQGLKRSSPQPHMEEGSGSLQKERELLQTHDNKLIEEIGRELELEKEVKEAGVEQIGEEIVLPEPVKQQGVEIAGPSIPITPPAPQLPLDEQKIQKALHTKVTEAIRWLAEWCLRQLKIQKRT